MLQGLIIGILGTVLGLILALASSWAIDYFGLLSLRGDVYIISRIPITLEPLDLTLIVVLSVLISFLATVYPSRQASRLTPVEAIRHE
jgi:lipoprotein-releasing system permease protein